MSKAGVFGRGAARWLVGGAAVVALGCDWTDDPIVEPPETPLPVLQPRYVLRGVNGVPLPYVLPGTDPRVRLIADTLVFNGAGTPPGVSGTYVEIRVIGTQQGTAAEVVTRTASQPRAWRRGEVYAELILTGFEGLGASSQANMQLANALAPVSQVSLFAPLGSYNFEPR